MDQLYFDGMTICSYMGFLDLFITLTCNPKWPKISKALIKLKLSSTNRPNIVSRVLKIKFEQLLTDLSKNHLLGETIACSSLYNHNYLILFCIKLFNILLFENKGFLLNLHS